MNRSVFTLLLTVFFVSLPSPSFAYPPDNAAVLYYKHMVNFNRPDKPLSEQLADAVKEDSKVSEELRKYLEEKKKLMNALKTASTIPICDWGLDYSEGLSLEMAHLGSMKEFAYLLLGEAKLKNQQGDPEEAIDTCLVVLRMAGHAGNETIISYLVGTAMSGLTYGAMEDILSSMPPEEGFLTDLQREMKLPEYNILNIKTPLLNESRCLADEILRMSDKKKELIEQMQGSEEIRKNLPLLLEAEPEFLRRSADYYQNFFDQYIKSLDQPYSKALQSFEALEYKPQMDYKAGKKEAFATMILAPDVKKVYNIDIRRRTQANALFTAIELYQIYAKNGSLPKELPADTPVDLFSGKPFAYEITSDGFVLRCNEKDRDKDKIQEYTFKIAP